MMGTNSNTDSTTANLNQTSPLLRFYDYLIRFRHLTLNDRAWFNSREGQASAARIKQYHNKYKGERCFIMGNGPSLNKTDLSKLQNEFTFGLNRIYLMFDELGFQTSFLVSVNKLVIEQCAEEISALKMPKFLKWQTRDAITFDEHTAFIRSSPTRTRFSKVPDNYLFEGATVTYVAMQLAYFMGFTEVNLIGVDHNFVTKGKPHKAIVSEGDDPNHFSPKYFGKGFKWQLPDLELSEYAYGLAKTAFEDDGRTIRDATVGGKLTVYPKVDYESLF